MRSPRARQLWLSALAAIVVGASFLLAWKLTHGGLPGGTLVVPRDAASISAALERVSPGGVIALDADKGPFAESFVVRVPGVTVRSVGRAAVLCGGEGTAIDVEADGVVIEGLVIEKSDVGISLAGTSCSVRRVSIRACDVGLLFAGGQGGLAQRVRVVDSRIGVDITSPAQTLHDVTCEESSEVGIWLRGAASALLDEITVTGARIGVLAEVCTNTHMTRGRISGCSDVGIRVLGGRETTISTSSVRRAVVGIRVEGAKDVTLDGCRLSECSGLAVEIVDATGCRVSSADIRSCGGGVRVTGGAGNAVLDAMLRDCGDVAVDYVGSLDGLVTRSALSGVDMGVRARDSDGLQVLRNSIRDAASCGVLLQEGAGLLVVDNVLEDWGEGIIAAVLDEGLFQRNRVRGSGSVGLSLAEGLTKSMVTENCIRGQTIGILVAGASRDVVNKNDVLDCQTGILLYRVGFGTRVQANRIVACDVGLSWSDAQSDRDSLGNLAFGAAQAASTGTPLVSDNEFRASRTFDLAVTTGSPLFAGGNSFRGTQGEASARVAGDVRLPPSASGEAVAIGAGTSCSSQLLSQLLAIFLSEKGFRVIDMAGFRSEGTLLEALERGDIDAAWCLADTGDHESWEIPARTGWVLFGKAWVLEARNPPASEESALSVTASSGADEDLIRQALGALGFAVKTFRVASSLDAAETEFQLGEADVAAVERIDETLSLAGYGTLDGATMLSATPIRFAVTPAWAATLRAAFTELAPRITGEALHELASRVRLLRRDPADVALDFLLEEGLLAE